MHKTQLYSLGLRFCYSFLGAKTLWDLQETGPRPLSRNKAAGDLFFDNYLTAFVVVNQVVLMLTSWHLNESSRELGMCQSKLSSSLARIYRPETYIDTFSITQLVD